MDHKCTRNLYNAGNDVIRMMSQVKIKIVTVNPVTCHGKPSYMPEVY